MTSPLERLAGAGKPLAAEPPDTKEFEGLKRSGLARLKDAANPANASESRFDLAYNAAHALSLAALRHKGFGLITVTQSFRYCRTHWTWLPRFGASSISVIRFAIWVSTRTTSTSTSELSPISSRLAGLSSRSSRRSTL